MNTIYKYPASKLPAAWREGFSDDDLVTVTISGASNDAQFPNLTTPQYDELFAESFAQKEQGKGIVCKTSADFDAYFDGVVTRATAKYNSR